jgi:hypothetical protein
VIIQWILKIIKLFCFNGRPEYIKVDFDRFSYDYPANYFEFYGICRIEEKSVVS